MNHWNRYHARWSKILPPLRPNHEVVANVQSLVGFPQATVLLLGVTPELAGAFDNVHAIDKSAEMIANVWPGDTPTRKATQGNWLSPMGHQANVDAVIGDGSLNAIWYPDEVRSVIHNAMAALVPGGIFICRMFERPGQPYSQRHLQRVTAEPAQMNFHAFKWQLAMHLAHEQGTNVAVASILEKFNEMWPDRQALSDVTGWDRDTIDSIDVYRGSDIVYSFPDRAEITAVVPDGATGVSFTNSGTYELADRCPLLSFRKPR
jgi:hypothetical protein